MRNGKKLMSLFLIPTLCLGLLTPVTSMGTVEAAGEVQSYNGHYYMFVNEIVEVGTAGLQADLMGGHLVTLTSAQEEEFVKKNVSGDTDIWLGATKQNGKWSWCTGEAFSYTNWHEGEPSNGSNENYLELWEGYWDDCDYDKNIGSGCAYVIEWDSKSAYDAYIQGNTTEMRKNITGTKTYNGHTYKYYSNKSTWKEAASYCKKLGGYLVTPTDKKENNFVYKLCGKSNTWIGMNDAKKEGKYVWVTGERTDYRRFTSEVNNNWAGTGEDYFGFYRGSTWNDYTNEGSSEGKLGFVCEWDTSNTTILTAVKTSVTMKAGKTAQLKYQIYPVKKKVTFKSSSPKVASVNKKGVITAKKAGKATITIKAGNKKVKVKVTVK